MQKLIHLFSHKNGLWFVLVIAACMHLPFLNEPPRSIHVWRQSITLAMSRNFTEEGMNLFEPKVDNRFDTDGITGSQFPSYEYVLATLYKIFGIHEPIHRLWSLSIYLLIIAGFYSLLLQVTHQRLYAFAGSWMLAFSPELYYQGINALPDILSLAALCWGLYFTMRWRNGVNVMDAVYAIACVGLAGLTKLQYLTAGLPLAIMLIQLWRNKEIDLTHVVKIALAGIISISLCLSWYAYAHYLTEKSGLRDIGLILYLQKDLAKGLNITWQNLTSDLPELLMGFASFVLFVFGLFRILKKRIVFQRILPFAVWLVSLLVYYFLAWAQMGVHQYYLLPFFPLLFIVSTIGFRWIYTTKPTIALILLLLAPVFAAIRIVPARWAEGEEGILQSFYQADTRNHIASLIPKNERVITGPDESRCINFYFTHTKGFGYTKPGDLFTTNAMGTQYIDDFIERGATYMIITDTADYADNRLKPYMGEVLFRNVELMVARIKKP